MQKQINRGYDSNCLDFYLNFAFDIAFGSDNSLGLVASNTLSFCQNSLAAFYFVPIPMVAREELSLSRPGH